VPEAIVGFKAPWDQLVANPVLLEVFRDPELRVIRSTRDDRLSQFLSFKLAHATGVWHSYQGEQPPARVTLDPVEYVSWVRDIDFAEAVLAALAHPHPNLTVDYAELADPGTLAAIHDLFGLDVETLRSDLVKVGRGNVIDSIENWDEFAAAVRSGPAAWTVAVLEG
jgi:hypothetical protein